MKASNLGALLQRACRGAASSQPQVKSGSPAVARPYPHKKTHQTTQGMPSGYYIQLRWSEARSRIEYHPHSQIYACVAILNSWGAFYSTSRPTSSASRIIHISQPSNAQRRACYVLQHNDNKLRCSCWMKNFPLVSVAMLVYHIAALI